MADEEFSVNNAPADDASAATAPFDEGVQVELLKVSMNGEVFLLPVHEIAEILRPMAVTPVPMAPSHMLGLANIRGQIVCIIDPGEVLHLKQKRGARSENTRFLILRHPRMHLGLWVDAVSDLYRVAKKSLPEADPDNHSHTRGEIRVDNQTFNLMNSRVLFE